MSSNVVNSVAFLRTAREYPEDLHQLTVEVNKSYVDIANAVNSRTISLYPAIRPAITGESWFVSSSIRNQTLRQIFPFTSTATIDIGFKISSIFQFSPRSYGSFTDGTNAYGLIFGSNVAIAGQISFYIQQNPGNPKTDRIAFLTGASAPTLTSGIIVLEWLVNV